MTTKTSIILDTDIGSDIDDAVALSYLLRQPLCELVGITTVSGNVAERAACAEVLCREAGRPDIPIHCGASDPLYWGSGQPKVPQYEAIRNLPHTRDWKQNTAIDYLRQTIRSRPGEITLLSIGPLTNVALLFAIDPEIPLLLKGFVSMAGSFYEEKKFPEWNCKVDSVANAMVYRAQFPNHISVGLDVTLKCQLSKIEVRERFKASPLNIALEMAEVWFAHSSPNVTFHDPLAAALIFNPSICQLERGTIVPEVAESHDIGGIVHFTPSPKGAQLVAKSVEVDAFFKEFFSVFE